jgi:hypothetical protein
MNMFRATFAIEFKRRLCPRDIIVFVIITAVVLFFVQYGKNKYLGTVDNIKVFQEAENNKVSQYVLYRQYGAFGLQLLFIPSPYSALFNDYAFDGLVSSINIAERSNIYKSVKGKGFFIARSGFMTFSGVILLFGVFASLLYGYDTTKSKEYLKLLADLSGSQNVFWAIMGSRVIILNLVFLVLVGISLLSLLIDNINLFRVPLIFMVVVLILVLTFFFAAGGVIGSLKKSIRGIVLGAIYLLSVGFIPILADIGIEINAADIDPLLKFDLHNLRVIMKNDKDLIDRYGSLNSIDPVPPAVVKAIKQAVKNEHGIIKKRESQMQMHMLKKIKQSQIASAFFPVLLYISTHQEISTHGGLSLVDFYAFGQQRKKEFIDFYVKKRFVGEHDKDHPKNNPDMIGPLDNFVKNDENLFYAKSHLPQGFLLGIGVTLVYIAVLFTILYQLHVKKPKTDIKTIKIDFKKGNTLLVLCKDEQVKGTIFQFFRGQQDAACIDKVTVDFQFNGIRADDVLRFFCQLTGIKRKRVRELLSIVGITDLNRLKLSNEEILKFYTVLKVSAEGIRYVILNDFFKKESREFEQDFFHLLAALETSGFKILYLSCQMYYPKTSLDEDIALETFCLFPLPIDKVTLR